jgi:protein kinase C substrate 80K-H
MLVVILPRASFAYRSSIHCPSNTCLYSRILYTCRTAAQTKKSWSVRLQEISKLEPDAQSKVNTLKNEYTSLKQRLSKLQAKKSRLEEILKPISDNLNESSEEGPSFVEGEGLEEIDDLGNDHDALLEEEDMVDEPGPGLRTEDYEEKEESSEELAKRVASQWIPGAKQDSGDEETHVEETSEDGLNSNHALEQEDGSTLSWDGTHEAEQSDAEQEKEETEEDDDGDHGFSFYDSMKLWFWETFARIQRTSISPSGKSDPHFEKLRMAVESLQKKVDAAQAALNAADESYSKLVDEKNDLEAKQGQSYGPDDVFVVLDDHCVEAHVEKYIYKICPFHGAEQLDAGRSTSLGKWTGMSFIEPQGGGTVRVTPAMVEFRFENGETCWQGPPRSIHVSVKCGSAESLYKVAEPSRCEYTAEMTTPAACSSELVTSLRRALDSKRTLLETMPKDEL